MSKKGWLITLVFTGIVVLIWVLTVVVKTKPSPPVSAQVKDALEAVDSNFDQETLKQVSSVQKPALLAAPKPSATPTPSPSLQPSPTPNLIVLPSTSSGTLSP
jgi:hypothetical protein